MEADQWPPPRNR